MSLKHYVLCFPLSNLIFYRISQQVMEQGELSRVMKRKINKYLDKQQIDFILLETFLSFEMEPYGKL